MSADTLLSRCIRFTRDIEGHSAPGNEFGGIGGQDVGLYLFLAHNQPLLQNEVSYLVEQQVRINPAIGLSNLHF